jgi:two-component system chemotaxis sensor kinase CheA
MDDLLSEFLTETAESLDVVDVELVKFEQEPNNTRVLDHIFRLVHTVKGTCGFLGLPRLEALAHAAETLMGKFRDGTAVTPEAVTLILQTIDRLKEILRELEAAGQEPAGADGDLIGMLDQMSLGSAPAPAAAAPAEAPAAPAETTGTLAFQVLERELKPGEVSLDELERVFRETEGPDAAEQSAPEPIAELPADEKPAEIASSARSAAEPAGDGEGRSEGGVKNQSIRVNVETLEHLMTTVSELVLTRNQLLDIARRRDDGEYKVPLQRLSNVTAELQEGVMQTRMQPIGNAWQKLPRIVRDLARELDKKIELEMSGAETELDRQVLDLIKDPLTHMVRNSADHGLEKPADRKAAGKPEKGTIRLSAYHEGGHIIIQISDDGRGIDVAKVRRKVLEKGLATEAELSAMTEAQIQKFIFDAGLSTAEKVTNVSGRGVGMDVVRNNIELIGGSIDLKSLQGAGSTFTIKIPLTLAIVSALIVEAGGQRYAVPQLNVIELVRAQSNSEHRIERIKDTPVLRLRNKLLPLVHLRQVLRIEEGEEATSEAPESGFIVVAQVGQLSFGIVVDGVFHTEEIVVKPMSSMLKDIGVFSGNTILGDGSVIMIIDPNGVAQAFGTALVAALEQAESEAEITEVTSEKRVSLLVFRAGSMQPKAVPLSLVTRLEEIEAKAVEHVNGRDVVQYRGQLMPLVHVNEEAHAKKEGRQPLLVFSDSERSMGLAVDEIVDIVEDVLDIKIASDRPGTLGSAVVKGRATEILDLGYYLPLASSEWFEKREMGEVAMTRSVLLVDDSPFFRNMLVPVLKAAGYRVEAVEGADKALTLLKEGRAFDVVVSDIEMPGMNGFELAESIRADQKLAEMPVIALSSHRSPAAIARGRQAGFYDFVAKFDREGLIAALKDAMTPMEEAA